MLQNGQPLKFISIHARPVATDVGAFAIGDFNDTMQAPCLDRQFRGEISALQIFGSRVGGREAMAVEKLKP